MARTAEATLLQQYATARETRASAIIAQRSDMQVLMDNAQNNGKPSNTKSGPISQKVPTLDSTSSDNDGNDENNDEDGETADDEEEEDEPEDFAPSELTKRKRGHQTGLSVSLSNTSIGKRSYDRKRARSLSDGSDDETRRPNKLPKSNHRPEPEIELESVSDDDSDYSGVDLISESEQEDTDIEREEEQQIIYDESSEGDMVIDQNQGAVSVESWEGFAGNDEIITHDPSLFSAQITGPNDADEMLSMTGALPDTPTQSRPARRVRFADDVEMDDQSSSSSSSSDSEVDHNIFPDIFVDQAQLAPEFRQMIEHGNEDTGSLPDSDNSWWDYEGVNTGQVMESALMEPVMNQLYPATTTAEDPNESDEGETTDEDPLPIVTVHHPQALLRLSSQPPRPRSKSAPTTPVRRQSGPSSKNKGPSMGSFSADTSKPYAWFSGKRKIIFIQPKTSQPTTARNSADSSAAGSPLLAFNPFDGSDSEDSGESLGGMLLSSPATVMMSGLLDGTGSQPNGQFVDPVEAFFPGISEQDDEALYDDDMDSDEDQIDINDLIQFPGESDDNSDSEDAIKTDPPLPQAAADETSNGQSLSNGSRNRNNNHFESRSESLLKHFDRGPVVSSFRRNQTRHQSLLRKPSFGASALYGIRGGRHAFANNPISPLRRRKGSLGSGKTQLLHKIATKRIDLAGRIRKRTNTF